MMMYSRRCAILKATLRTATIPLGLALVLSLSLSVAERRQAAAEATPSKSAASSTAPFQRLIDRYCVSCHNEELNTASFRLDNIDLAHVSENGEIWEKVIHKLRTEEMPPIDRPQPSKGARRALLSHLATTLDEVATTDPDPGRPAVHRLNRSEYANAVRDLLALEIDSHDFLPSNGADFGFDNIADSLNLSPMLLERYMAAASKISRLAIGDIHLRPSATIYTAPKALLQMDRMGKDFSFGSRGGMSARHHFPLDGEYVVKIDVESPRSDQPSDLFQRSDAPEQLDVRLDGERIDVFNIGKPKTGQWSYEKNGFAEEKPADKEDLANWWGARTLEVRFPAKAGTHAITTTFLKRTLAYEGVRPRNLPAFYDYLGLLKNMEPGVIEMEVSGPYDATSLGEESPSREKVFSSYPTSPEDELKAATKILSTLAREAYRRPVTPGDMDTLLTFYAEGHSEGGFEAGIQFALERILVSPSFLFRVELQPTGIVAGEAFELTDIELASRLAFFLWSSIPDEELLQIAERGELRNPGVLEGQVRRMLADARSESLVDNFATQWLYLRNMEAVTPDVNIFPDFDGNLREAMRRETELFFSSQLREDRSVPELLSANYTFLNHRLAEHYGISDIYGSHFRRVELDDPNRGGLMGQASIWTVTSYATRTSPVKRGKWILENLLGSPPPSPPDGVPPLPEPSKDTEGLTTRQLFEKHRADPGCASCHIKMDPLGFALENFDAIGKWRTHSSFGLALDTTGTMPDGTLMEGPSGLRSVLMDNDTEFTRTAVKKLLLYALGRGIEYYDQPAIRKIMRDSASDDYRWSSIILGIVNSTPFQMRRSS